MKRFFSPRNFMIVALFVAVIVVYSNRARLIGTFERKVGLEPADDTSDSCPKDSIFSQKSCKCIADSYRCKGLDKSECEKNQNCYSFSRSGSCGCQSCESALDHQCLPIDELLNIN